MTKFENKAPQTLDERQQNLKNQVLNIIAKYGSPKTGMEKTQLAHVLSVVMVMLGLCEDGMNSNAEAILALDLLISKGHFTETKDCPHAEYVNGKKMEGVFIKLA
jgi:hypothetical protein